MGLAQNVLYAVQIVHKFTGPGEIVSHFFQYPAQVDKSVIMIIMCIWYDVFSLHRDFTQIKYNTCSIYLLICFIHFIVGNKKITNHLSYFLNLNFSSVRSYIFSALALLQLLTEFVSPQGGRALTKRSQLLLRTCKSIMLFLSHFVMLNTNFSISLWAMQMQVKFELVLGCRYFF